MTAASDTEALAVHTYHTPVANTNTEKMAVSVSGGNSGESAKATAAARPMSSLGIRPIMRDMRKNSEQQSQAIAEKSKAVGMAPQKRQIITTME